MGRWLLAVGVVLLWSGMAEARWRPLLARRGCQTAPVASGPICPGNGLYGPLIANSGLSPVGRPGEVVQAAAILPVPVSVTRPGESFVCVGRVVLTRYKPVPGIGP